MQLRVPTSPPKIAPVSGEEKRPLWSVMIPVYNCGTYFPETIKSVLLQNIAEEDMQIEVVDDASTDVDVEALVAQIGKGRVKYFRQPQNVGSLRNFETCINRSRGRLIHLLHGDDKVNLGYYSKIDSLFKTFPQAGATYCRFKYIDGAGIEKGPHSLEMNEEGILQNWLVRIAERNCIQYSAITVKREVYENLGSFYGTTFGEDWEMWVRISRDYAVAYTPEILAEYRHHDQSITGGKFLNGEALRDVKRIIELVQEYLPESQRKTVLRKSRKYYSWYGLEIAQSTWKKTQNKKIVHNQIKQLLEMYHGDIIMYKIIIKLYIKMLINYK